MKTYLLFLLTIGCLFLSPSIRAVAAAKCDEEREMIRYDGEVSAAYKKCGVEAEFIKADTKLAEYLDDLLDDADKTNEALMTRTFHFQSQKERDTCASVFEKAKSIRDFRNRSAVGRFVVSLNRAPAACPGAKKSQQIKQGLAAHPGVLSDYTKTMVKTLSSSFTLNIANCGDSLKSAKKKEKADWELYCGSNAVPIPKDKNYKCMTSSKIEERQKNFDRVLNPIRKMSFDENFDMYKMIDHFRAVDNAVADDQNGSSSCRKRVSKANDDHMSRMTAVSRKQHFEGTREHASDNPKTHGAGSTD